jgi:trk system potassium uptake protein
MPARLKDTPLLVTLTGLTAALCFLPAAHAFLIDDNRTARGFVYSGLMLGVLVAMVTLATRHRPPVRLPGGNLMALVGAYLILPIMMALPILQTVPDTTFVNAWFETLSAFTTTGATVYPEPGRLPPSVHLWRALIGWFGGLLILVAAFAILAPMNLGGIEVISGRVPGRGAMEGPEGSRASDATDRISRTAKMILPAYAGLTGLLWVGLLIAGAPALDALCIALSTLSTSGITAEAGVNVAGIGGEVLVACFLLFAVTRRAMPGPRFFETTRIWWRDPEALAALTLLLAVPSVLFLRHFLGASPEARSGEFDGLSAIWGAVFTTLSFLTTAGFQSESWSSAQGWSGLGSPGLILLGLAIVGGGVATTAGGVKLLRVYALFRHSERELELIVHPHSVGGQGRQARRLRREGAYMAWIFFMLFATLIGVFVAMLTLLGLDFESALVLSVAALTTTGPLADVASATPIAYSPLGTDIKVALGLAMIVGRLETLALLTLFSPATWRR